MRNCLLVLQPLVIQNESGGAVGLSPANGAERGIDKCNAYSLCTPQSVKTVKADMCMVSGGGNMPIKRAFLFAYLHSVQMQKKETAFLRFLHFL